MIRKPAHVLFFTLSVLLLIYTGFKSWNNSFTHDESFTYNHYVHLAIGDIILNKGPDIPNNHILNTLMMKGFDAAVGPSEFALRLPNWMAHCAFILFTYLWLRKFRNTAMLLIGFAVMNLNIYLLDFFSLARGYGLSVSFMFISVYYLYNFLNNPKWISITWSFTAGALAVWSNFTLLNYYAALLAISGFYIAFLKLQNKNSIISNLELIKMTYFIIGITVFLVLLILVPLQTIKGNLFGPEVGFYQNTIRSLAFCTIRYDVNNAVTLLSGFIFFITIISGIIFLSDFIKKKYNLFRSPSLMILLLLLLAVISTQLQHLFFNTQFLENRTGLFYIVLFNVCYVHLMHFLIENYAYKLFFYITGFLYPAILIISFIFNFQLSGPQDWMYDSCTKSAVKLLSQDYLNSRPPQEKVRLGATWIFEPALNFYRKKYNLIWLSEITRDDYHAPYDYYYIHDDSAFVRSPSKHILMEYPVCKNVLAKTAHNSQHILNPIY